MSHPRRFIAPCEPTRPPQTSAGGKTTANLPEELLTEQVKRLGVFSAVMGALWTYGLLMDLVIVPVFLPSFASREIHGKGIPIELVAIALSVAMFLYMRFARHLPETKATAGLGYMIVNAAAIGMLNNWITTPVAAPGVFLSWNTNLILVFSMIAPAAPRRMLPASLIAASMDPLAAWTAHLRGLPTLPLFEGLLLYAPNYTAALLALLPGKIIHHIGKRLREAQEMGSYQLIELLGQGGMGEVWRARHRLLARNAAIKLVRPEALDGDAANARLMMQRFEREAQATASLSSPHTIRVFDYGMTADGTFYYVMELLSGRDLESLVREFGPVPANRALMLLRQACHSLADAHARGMVHRDIKPANLYVCRMGLEYDFVKVLDFGLVKLRDRGLPGATLMTLEQTTTGTPAYMAPEIILGEADVDSRADVYALGCVAYYLLTGELVFQADTTMKMMMQHVNAEPVPPSQRTELPIPREVDEMVLACLRKDPRERPQNASEMFDIACRCTTRDLWTQEAAKHWWEHHLPEMTGPLILGEAEPNLVTVVGVPR